MEDTKHTFNVVFNTENRVMTNLHVFHVLPIYWTTIVVPVKGDITGEVTLFGMGRDLVTGSAVFTGSTVVKGIPTMNYSACMVFSGCTTLSASPISFYEEALLA